MFDLGYAHCAEIWRNGRMVGGVSGLALGRAFFGESMFSLEPNTSKLALSALCRRLAAKGYLFLDCQQATWPLHSLGAGVAERGVFLTALAHALTFETELGPWDQDAPTPSSRG